jgi:hypothetical protein
LLDVVFVATLIAFFALMVAFVRWCEHIVGAEDVTPIDPEEDTEPPTEGDDPPDPEELVPASATTNPEEVPS